MGHNKQVIIIDSFNNDSQMRAIMARAPETVIFTRDDHVALYASNRAEKIVSAERWNIPRYELAELIREWGNDYNYASPASFAFSLFKRNFMRDASWFMPTGIDRLDYRAQMARDSLYGGRCEVLRFGKHHLHQYDINSSYPYSASRLAFPEPRSGEYVKQPKINYIMRYAGVSEVVFSQSGNLPVLPLRFRGRTLFAECEYQTGRYTHNELRYAIGAGATIHKINKQFVFTAMLADNPFTEFVEYCYERRKDARVWKQIINALFGRLATVNRGLLRFRLANSRQEMIEAPKSLKHWFGANMIANELKSAKSETNLLWAAMITADARCNLRNLAVNRDTFYIDTDCLFVASPQGLSVSDVLGQFKHKEGEYNIRGAKQYSINDKIVMKGLSLQSKPQARYNNFMASRYTNERRRINDDGETAPHWIDASGASSLDAAS